MIVLGIAVLDAAGLLIGACAVGPVIPYEGKQFIRLPVSTFAALSKMCKCKHNIYQSRRSFAGKS